MVQQPTETGLDTEIAEQLVTAARTSVGETLRSVVVFTPADFDVLYVRSDLYDSTEETRPAKGRLVEFERVGFAEAPARTGLADSEHRSTIGPYEFTVRFHDDGFVVRQIVDNVGVLLTADTMDVRDIEEAETAIRSLLSE